MSESLLGRALQGGGPVLTMEADPPQTPDLRPWLAELSPLRGLVAAVNVTDSPLGRPRVSALAAAAVLQRELGLETVMHMACRDKNRIALRAEILGAKVLGIPNVLTLKGDVPREGKPVFELETVDLIRLIVDTVGDGVLVGTTANPGASDLAHEVSRLEDKVRAGAKFVQTQPVFGPETAEKFARLAEPLGIPVLFGVMVFTGLRQARFMDEHVPGISVPGWVMERLAERDTPEEGAAIALEIATQIAHVGRGVHLFPMQQWRLARDIAAELKVRWQGSGSRVSSAT